MYTLDVINDIHMFVLIILSVSVYLLLRLHIDFLFCWFWKWRDKVWTFSRVESHFFLKCSFFVFITLFLCNRNIWRQWCAVLRFLAWWPIGSIMDYDGLAKGSYQDHYLFNFLQLNLVSADSGLINIAYYRMSYLLNINYTLNPWSKLLCLYMYKHLRCFWFQFFRWRRLYKCRSPPNLPFLL